MKNWKQFIATCLTFALLIVGVCLAAPAFAGMALSPGMAAHVHSDANTGGGSLALSGTLSSTKACAAGYTRITPNYCSVDSMDGGGNIAPAALCLGAGLSGGTDVKAVVLGIIFQFASTNAIASYTSGIDFYDSSSSCLTLRGGVSQTVREFAAIPAGTIFGVYSEATVIRPSTSQGIVWMKSTLGNAQSNTKIFVRSIGYFD